jgi:hypothetical protein
MCDIVTIKCEACDNLAEVHIADFCVPSKHVHVLCPECVASVAIAKPRVWSDKTRKQASRWNKTKAGHCHDNGIGCSQLFWDVVGDKGTITDKKGKVIGRRGQVVLLWVDDEFSGNAFGIYLNG